MSKQDFLNNVIWAFSVLDNGLHWRAFTDPKGWCEQLVNESKTYDSKGLREVVEKWENRVAFVTVVFHNLPNKYADMFEKNNPRLNRERK